MTDSPPSPSERPRRGGELLPLATPDDALFDIDDDGRIHPTPYTGGPWNAAHQHGGAVCALLAREVEVVPTAVPMRVVRLTVDMFRGVPLAALTTERRVVRAGRRIQVSDVDLFSEGVRVARATALSVRIGDEPFAIDEAADRRARPRRLPPPGTGQDIHHPDEFQPPGFVQSVDGERLEGRHGSGVPASGWFRWRCPVVRGEVNSPLVDVACCADFASGWGSYLDFSRQASINADLSIYLLRHPRSEWVGLDASYRADPQGVAIGTAHLHDLDGPIGRVLTGGLLV